MVEQRTHKPLVASSNLAPAIKINDCAPRIEPRGAFSFKGFGLRGTAYSGIVGVYIQGVQNAARGCT